MMSCFAWFGSMEKFTDKNVSVECESYPTLPSHAKPCQANSQLLRDNSQLRFTHRDNFALIYKYLTLTGLILRCESHVSAIQIQSLCRPWNSPLLSPPRSPHAHPLNGQHNGSPHLILVDCIILQFIVCELNGATPQTVPQTTMVVTTTPPEALTRHAIISVKLDNIKPLCGLENYEIWSCQVTLVLFAIGAKSLVLEGTSPMGMSLETAQSLMQQALLIIIQLVAEPIMAQIASFANAHEI